MRIRSAILVLCVMTSACLQNPAMNTNTIQTMQTRGYGSYVEVTGLKGEFVNGELLAVMREKVWVLDANGKRQWINIRYIRDAKLYKYQSDWGFGLWGLIGSLSTISHGFWLILTFPLWILSSGITAAVESYHVRIGYPDHDIEDFAKWARFPQGMPLDVTPQAPPAPAAREQAWQITKQAMGAARADDCALVKELDVRVRELDAELHASTFQRDEAIRRCLGLPSGLFPPTSSVPPAPTP